jgi:myosin-9
LFGIPLTQLCAQEGGKIPGRVDQLITKIEFLGLYTEGIYRKSGVSSKIKELKLRMSEGGEIDYEYFNVHVLTNVLKSFLREMPEPLLTFDRYDDFLRAADLSDDSDRVQTLLSLIKKLPLAHHALLERIVFHLALVAQREQYNRMSASSLAIVFAPCVLRTNRYIPAQDSLNDISRQTKCMETLISQKMLNVKITLADIDTLDTAAHTATTRLSTLRSSKVFSHEEFTATSRARESEAEEILLMQDIQEIQKEKALLTSTLPSLARASSDDDLLSTDLDGEGGSLDDLSNSKDKELNSLDVSLKDSADSVSCDTTTNNSNIQNDVEMQDLAVSYNLRDRNIDYIPSPNVKTMLKGTQLHKPLDGFQRQQNYRQESITTCSINSAANIMKTNKCELQRHKSIVMRNTNLNTNDERTSKNIIDDEPILV